MSGGNNLETTTECGFTGTGDLQNARRPLLAPLADNGGETDTHAIPEGSPARDAAGGVCAATDQRGISRPQGAACDIGSFELELAAFATITSTGPLTSISLGRNLECQVELAGVPQIFDGGPLGSCTTGLVGVDLAQVSQTVVEGSGTPGSPYMVVTQMSNGSGITLERTDTYVTGERFWQSQVRVSNGSSTDFSGVLWHGLDCLVAGNDAGYGFFAAATGAVYCAEHQAGGDIMLGLEPISGGSNYHSGDFGIATNPGPSGFGNTCSGDLIDNGVGLSWPVSVPAETNVTRSFVTTFEAGGALCGASDTTAPDAAISLAPAASTPSRDATFGFGSSDPTATFECSLDGGAFAACTSPTSYTGLSEGPHSFVVRAIDGAGNESTASHSWTIAAQAQRKTLADLPPPVVGKMANVEPVKGTVLVAIPAGKASAGGAARASQKGLRFVPLERGAPDPGRLVPEHPQGHGPAQTARTGSAATTQSGTFASGLFQVLQSRKRRPRA